MTNRRSPGACCRWPSSWKSAATRTRWCCSGGSPNAIEKGEDDRGEIQRPTHLGVVAFLPSGEVELYFAGFAPSDELGPIGLLQLGVARHTTPILVPE